MKHLFTLLLLSVPLSTFAQQYLGLMNQQYAGTHRLYLNPAEVAAGKAKMSYNTFSTGFTFHNNYASWQAETPFFKSLIQGDRILEGFAPNGNELNTFGVNTEMRGPAGMLHLGSFFGLGLASRIRGDIQVQDASLSLLELARLGIDDPSFAGKNFVDQQFGFTNSGITEIALSLGSKIPLAENHSIYAGISIKYLLSFSNSNLQINEIDYRVEETEGRTYMNISRIAGALSYSRPDINGLSFNNIFSKVPGKGWGTDIGFLYSFKGEGANPVDLSFGMALLDVGQISYSGDLVRAYTFERNDGLRLEDMSSLSSDPVNGLKEFLNLQENQGQADYSQQLPTTLSFQADLQLAGKFGLSGLMRKQTTASELASVANYAGIIPRFELKKFGVSMPIMLMQDYTELSLGTTFRIGPWFIGSDNLLSAVKNSDISHINYYTGFAFNIGDSW